MKISLLNICIDILKNEVRVDAIGNHRNVWVPYYSCHATVSAEGGKEMTEAGMVVDDSTADFTIRWCDKSKDLVSTGFRVRFGNDEYDILSVDHMNFKHKCIKLKCKKVRR